MRGAAPPAAPAAATPSPQKRTLLSLTSSPAMPEATKHPDKVSTPPMRAAPAMQPKTAVKAQNAAPAKAPAIQNVRSDTPSFLQTARRRALPCSFTASRSWSRFAPSSNGYRASKLSQSVTTLAPTSNDVDPTTGGGRLSTIANGENETAALRSMSHHSGERFFAPPMMPMHLRRSHQWWGGWQLSRPLRPWHVRIPHHAQRIALNEQDITGSGEQIAL